MAATGTIPVSPSRADTSSAATSPRPGPVIALLVVAAFVVILNETTMSVALPAIMADFGVSAATGQWLTSAGNSAVYGTPQTVTFRACRDAGSDYCGADSGGTLRCGACSSSSWPPSGPRQTPMRVPRAA